MLEADLVADAVSLFIEARRSRRPIADLPAELRPHDIDEAYQIQEGGIAPILELAGGGAPVGRKIGATSQMAQEMLKLEAPFRGVLLSPFVHNSPATIKAYLFFTRIIECEFAFRMARDLAPSGAPYSQDQVRSAVASVMPAIEIVDLRLKKGTNAGGLQVIADLGGAGHWVYGEETDRLDSIDFGDHAVTVTVDGALQQNGNSAAVLGNPFAALTWLANDLAAAGQTLRAGEMVTTGSCTPLFPASAGETVEADFGPLGTVSVRFD